MTGGVPECSRRKRHRTPPFLVRGAVPRRRLTAGAEHGKWVSITVDQRASSLQLGANLPESSLRETGSGDVHRLFPLLVLVSFGGAGRGQDRMKILVGCICTRISITSFRGSLLMSKTQILQRACGTAERRTSKGSLIGFKTTSCRLTSPRIPRNTYLSYI